MLLSFSNNSMHNYFRSLPITAGILLINISIFIIAKVIEIPWYFLSTPGFLSIGSFLSHFSHFDILHILMNMAVFSQISPLLERALSKTQYLACIIAIWLLTVFIAQPFLTTYSLGFSGILMGLITLTAILYWHLTPMRQQLLVMTGINIAIGLLPGISFLMHFVGAFSGCIVGVLLTIASRHE